MFRFIHTSDLHLGKRFGAFEGDLPARLREARHRIIPKLAQLAYEHDVDTILLAGDTFDSETPAPDIRRQALHAMATHEKIKWVILPGNHDSLQAVHLWERLHVEASSNIILALEPQAIELAPFITLLPAPCTTRRPGRDLSSWMDEYKTDEHVIRIGLAHGGIRNFHEDGGADDIIAPDRARSACLDYLALGDWHGQQAINPRTYYCGTPEPDRFKHQAPSTALLVSIEVHGAIPQVTPLPTASFHWLTAELPLLETDDPCARLQEILPSLPQRRQTLLRLSFNGYTHLSMRTQLNAKIEQIGADFAFLDVDDSAVSLISQVNDLDNIAESGALRAVADQLLAEGQDPLRSKEARAIAMAALARLYWYSERDTENRQG